MKENCWGTKMKQKIYIDENDGKEYALDERGNKVPPLQLSQTLTNTGSWDLYDTSQGHCALCGRLVCHGCFK
jgi:hypothetical protein